MRALARLQSPPLCLLQAVSTYSCALRPSQLGLPTFLAFPALVLELPGDEARWQADSRHQRHSFCAAFVCGHPLAPTMPARPHHLANFTLNVKA